MDWQIYPVDRFEQYRELWDNLNVASGDTPLLDSRFVRPLLVNFGTKQEKLAICRIDGNVCGMSILTKTGFGAWETFQPSQAPVGCWLQNADLPIDRLGGSLRQALSGAGLILGITQQDPYLLTRPVRSRNIDTVDYIETACVAVDDSFDNYWSKRGKNLRQNLRRQRNRLARENVETKLSVIRDPDSMYSAVKSYGSLESAGWKSTSNTAIHIDNSQGQFYSEMLQNFAETDQAIVYQYLYNDELVATDLCIIGGGSLIILKTTYDETINSTSPAMLMREDAFRDIFSQHLSERIEFYGKVMDWHTKWSEDVRTMYHINIYSRLGSLIQRIRKN